jgi:hypothetical protein
MIIPCKPGSKASKLEEYVRTNVDGAYNAQWANDLYYRREADGYWGWDPWITNAKVCKLN